MIVVDIETSGLYPEKHGIWQIGALDFYNPGYTFLEEAKIDDEDLIESAALTLTGMTEERLRDGKKQSQKELIEHFLEWTEKIRYKNLICQNFFDHDFLTFRTRKYGLGWPLHYRAFDLHSIAQTIYFMKNGKFLYSERDVNHSNSDMGLTNIMSMCGLEDTRMRMKEGQVIKEGTPHNALTDAKIEAECLRRLLAR